MSTTYEEKINQMYDSQLNSQKEQLKTDYETTLSNMDAQQAAARKEFDQKLRDTRVDSQKSAVNNAEYYAAAGLSSGAKAQARLSSENQLLANLTALRAAQQQADAETDRQRTLLAKEYASAIQKAQADNDLARAQALYEEAKSEDEKLLAKQQASAQLLAQNGDFSGVAALYGLTPEQVQALNTNYNRTQEEAAAQLMAQAGDYTRLGALYGLTPEEIAKLSGGSSGGSAGGNTVGDKYSGVANNGGVADASIIEMQNELGVTADGRWGPKTREAAQKRWGTTDPDKAWEIVKSNFRSTMESDLNTFIANGASKSKISSYLSAAYKNGYISKAEYDQLKDRYIPRGYTY